MIRRVVEYVVSCDNPECQLNGDCTAYGSFTREDCERDARKHGWQPVSRKKWLCQRCAEAIFDRQKRYRATMDAVEHAKAKKPREATAQQERVGG